jgi:apolipoprotein N-acyltransferase
MTVPLQDFAGRVLALRGWRVHAVAAAGGALATLAHAPFHVIPLYAVAMCILVLVLDGAASRSKSAWPAFARAWSFAFAHFLTSTYWVGNAFLQVDGAAALAPLGVLALPAGLALFWGGAAALAMPFWTQDARRIPVFAVAFTLAELLRGHAFTGFPWQLPGAIWQGGGAVSQIASLVGIYGLSALTLLVFAAPATVLRSPPAVISRLAPTFAALLTLGLIWGWGEQRLAAQPTIEANGPRIRIVDPGLTQEQKWSIGAASVLARYLELTGPPSPADSDEIVIWPEGAIPPEWFQGIDRPLSVLDRADFFEAIGQTLGDRTLVLGSLRTVPRKSGGYEAFNSAVIVDAMGGSLRISQTYDKHHLVPFGEYIPFWNLVSALPIAPLQQIGAGFTRGQGPERLVIPGAGPAGILMCYEGIFQGYVPRGQERPDWIINVSIDAWFGRQTGPWQHANLVRYRAIEEGLPLARAASGGISGVYDPFGRKVSEMGIEGGALISALPSPIAPTLFASWGFVIVPALLIAIALLRFVPAGGSGLGLRS